MFQVQKEGNKHIIHGSFKKLDYLKIINTGVFELPKANKKMIKRLSDEHLVIGERNNPNALIDKSVVWIDHTALVNEDLIGYCKGVRMLMIENDCDSLEVMELKLVNMPNLERIEIGKNCFSKVTSFHVQHCPKLRRVFIGDGSFTKCMDCVIEDNAKLLELQLGGNDGVSISKPSDKNEKTPKDKCSIENNSATKDSTENNSATKNSTEDTGEALSLDSPDKKGSSEPKLKLASCFSSVERNE